MKKNSFLGPNLKVFLLFMSFVMLVGIDAYGQEVISTQGESYTNANSSMDFTIGEVVINTGSDGSNDITQGFHQTNWSFVGLDDFSESYFVQVFPNPMMNSLWIKTDDFSGVNFVMHDANGKLILEGELDSPQTVLEVAHLEVGYYTITLIKNAQQLKTFKLIKNT